MAIRKPLVKKGNISYLRNIVTFGQSKKPMKTATYRPNLTDETKQRYDQLINDFNTTPLNQLGPKLVSSFTKKGIDLATAKKIVETDPYVYYKLFALNEFGLKTFNNRKFADASGKQLAEGMYLVGQKVDAWKKTPISGIALKGHVKPEKIKLKDYILTKGKNAGQVSQKFVLTFDNIGMSKAFKRIGTMNRPQMTKVIETVLKREGISASKRKEIINKVMKTDAENIQEKTFFIKNYGYRAADKYKIADATPAQLLDAFKKAEEAKGTKHTIVKNVLDQKTGKVKKQLHFGAGELSRTLFKNYEQNLKDLSAAPTSTTTMPLIDISKGFIEDLKKAGINEQRALTILGSTQKMGDQGQALAMAFMDTFGAKAYADLYSSEKVKNKAGSLRKEIYERIQHPERYGLVGKTPTYLNREITKITGIINNANAFKIAQNNSFSLEEKVSRLKQLAKNMGISLKKKP